MTEAVIVSIARTPTAPVGLPALLGLTTVPGPGGLVTPSAPAAAMAS